MSTTQASMVASRRFPRTWFVFTEAEGDNPSVPTTTKRNQTQGENEGGIVVFLAYDGDRTTGQEIGRVAWDRTLKSIPKDMQKIDHQTRLAQVLDDAHKACEAMNKEEQKIAAILKKEDMTVQLSLDGIKAKINNLKTEIDKEIKKAEEEVTKSIEAQNKKIEDMVKEQDKRISNLLPKSKSKGLT